MVNADTHRAPAGRRPLWNVLSVVAPFAGFLCGFVVGTFGQGVLWQGHPAEGAGWGLLVWGVSCAFGLLAAILSWTRAERLWGVTLLGFILNALPFVWAVLSGLLGGWFF